MTIKIMTAKEEATELLTKLLVRKGIQIDAVDIEIIANIINLFVKASFQAGAGKLREIIVQMDVARNIPIQDA